MIRHFALAAALLAAPASAQGDAASPPSPGEIVAQAAPSEWIPIDPDDLLVMALAPDADGKERQVVIQLMPPPFSQPWVANIRTLAKAHWWDGLAIVRSQENYVVQWGDPEGEDEAKARTLPAALETTREEGYVIAAPHPRFQALRSRLLATARERDEARAVNRRLDAGPQKMVEVRRIVPPLVIVEKDPYAGGATFDSGWPVALSAEAMWPVHCYGMVGVGRGMSPDAGSGAELYTVIGHAPRHLDRNIAVVGRVVEGIEHLSTLPRGTGPLGFYETPEERVPIASIRLASELPEAERPRFEYLTTEGETFARYAESRANRRDPFFIVPAGGADVCNIPVPVRRVSAAG